MTEHTRARSAGRPERWIREDASPRLEQVAPGLTSLKLELHETAGERRILDSTRIQHVIVPRAAALFEIACGEPGCQDGGFDVTVDVLHALRHRSTQFYGEASCYGTVGHRPCERVLKYRGVAEWSKNLGHEKDGRSV